MSSAGYGRKYIVVSQVPYCYLLLAKCVAHSFVPYDRQHAVGTLILDGDYQHLVEQRGTGRAYVRHTKIYV